VKGFTVTYTVLSTKKWFWPKISVAVVLLLLFFLPYCGVRLLHDQARPVIRIKKPPTTSRVKDIIDGVATVVYTAIVVGCLLASIIGAISPAALTNALIIYAVVELYMAVVSNKEWLG
jgi:hypothetical protein